VEGNDGVGAENIEEGHSAIAGEGKQDNGEKVEDDEREGQGGEDSQQRQEG